MMSHSISLAHEGEYAWELAMLYPEQGEWSEEEYLRVTDETNGRVEFTDGRLEFLPLPTEIHEALVQFLFLALHQHVSRNELGKVYSNGIRLRLRPGKIRLPDVIFLHKAHFHARHNRAWDGADLVMEVVSEDPRDRDRDYQTKLADYAEAGVAEYWIADGQRGMVTVHHLQDGRYEVHGQFPAGEHATSVLLDGFEIDVAALFEAVKDIPD